ncbi:MAG: pyruvate dehydrogenase (acetyl-transferring) E1 component subunit alpha, partial [Chloroflexi bacterium]|nr:pyruvate dehydrogenase (acetyl-transferring) E1 component subunit alpha [Chloroflexota bacterium]
MYLIRQFEEKCGEMYTRGQVRGFLHLYIGEEAIAVGAISQLQPHDYIVTHYRDHGHALARGLDTNRTMAELFGRVGGLSKGKGGSMHLFDADKGFIGGHAIVGGQFPLAAGLALSHQYRKKDGV